MAQLYPPSINGTLPAFTNGLLVIPYEMNRSVSMSQVAGFAVKIKLVQSGFTLKNIKIRIDGKDSGMNYIDVNNQKIYVDVSQIEKVVVGQYYKIQIAYLQKGILEDSDLETGYYSQVGVVKYTGQPQISIDGLIEGALNINHRDFIGKYVPPADDITELEYSYCFNFYEQAKGKPVKLVATTGTLLHNFQDDSTNTNNESLDYFAYPKDLIRNSIYYIEYIVTTINNLELSTPKYKIVAGSELTCELAEDYAFYAGQDEYARENGYVKLYFKPANGAEAPTVEDSNGNKRLKTYTGNFKILRAEIAYGLNKEDDHNLAISDENIGLEWVDIAHFTFANSLPGEFLWRDFSVEQGKTYIYAAVQYNGFGIHLKKMGTGRITIDFEHCFLFDGKRQLKLIYNPKVSSFKTTIQDTKIETIGSKYPFFFRNGIISYKEFPLSCLLSLLSDEDYFFRVGIDAQKDPEIRRDSTRASDMVIEPSSLKQMRDERAFKLQVLDWLNDGKPKLFRSPAEGNYLIRLMNVSLSPIDSLGRKLHTMNSTAYEVDDCTYANLLKYGIITDLIAYQAYIETPGYYDLYSVKMCENEPIIGLIRSVQVEGASPGSKLQLIDKDGNVRFVTIGQTGTYYLNTNLNDRQIYLQKVSWTTPTGAGVVTCWMDQQVYDKANDLIGMSEKTVPIQTFSISQEDMIRPRAYWDILAWFKSLKIEINKLSTSSSFSADAVRKGLASPLQILWGMDVSDIFQTIRPQQLEIMIFKNDEVLNDFKNKMSDLSKEFSKLSISIFDKIKNQQISNVNKKDIVSPEQVQFLMEINCKDQTPEERDNWRKNNFIITPDGNNFIAKTDFPGGIIEYTVAKIDYIRAYAKQENYYAFSNQNRESNINRKSPWYYKKHTSGTQEYQCWDAEGHQFDVGSTMDFTVELVQRESVHNHVFDLNKIGYMVWDNDSGHQPIDVTKITDIKIGNGVVLEIGYTIIHPQLVDNSGGENK